MSNLPRYLLGTLLLGVYQFLQWWFDTQLTRAIDAAVAGARDRAMLYGAWLGVVALVAFGIRVASRLVIFNAGRIAEYQLRRALLARLHRLGPAFFGTMNAGEIMSRATNDLTQLRLLLGFCVLNLINTAFGLVSGLSVTFGISARLTVAALATFPLLVVATLRFARLSYVRHRDSQAEFGRMSEVVQSSLVGIRVVKTQSLEPTEAARFARSDALYLEKSLSLAHLRGSMGPLMQAITSVSIVVVVWYGGELMLRGEISPGGLLAFLRALSRLTWPLIALGFLVGIVQRGRASYARLLELYDAEPEIKDGPIPAPSAPHARLDVRGLSYSYGANRVLEGVSFTLVPGQTLAIVGRTGSGKSTLAALLARILPAPAGTIFIDGQDVCDLPVAHTRSMLGYARQSAFLFSTTAARNVGFCFDHPESGGARAVIEHAAEAAQVLNELSSLPDGLDTVVGERGVQLSGGQKQRVALARAFASEPRLLLLDDPLSAVDARTEKEILEVLDEYKRQRGVILITHRVAAAARCDRIIVLEAGRIVASGTHAELLAQGGIYRRFADEQRRTSEIAELIALPIATNGGHP